MSASRQLQPPLKTTGFALFPPGARFTDGAVLTVATAQALLGDGDYTRAYRRFGRAFPHVGYWGSFYRWLGRDGACPIVSFPDATNPMTSSHPGPRICCRRFE